MPFRIRLQCTLILLVVACQLLDFIVAKKDLYKVLGVSKGCSSRDLQKAYRKAALKHHPDKVPADQRDKAEQKFKEIGEAYEGESVCGLCLNLCGRFTNNATVAVRTYSFLAPSIE